MPRTTNQKAAAKLTTIAAATTAFIDALHAMFSDPQLDQDTRTELRLLLFPGMSIPDVLKCLSALEQAASEGAESLSNDKTEPLPSRKTEDRCQTN